MGILNEPYKHNMTRLYTGIFGTIFNDIKIERADGKIIKVPLVYSSKKGYVVRNSQNENPLQLRYSKQLPIMGMTFNGWEYDETRKTSRYNRIQHATKDRNLNTEIETQYNKVPYKFSYTLSIMTKTYNEMFQIVESILAYFNPNVEIVVKDNPDLDMESSVSVRLVSNSLEDGYEGSFEDSDTTIDTTLEFELDGWVLLPTEMQKVIQTVVINYKDITENDILLTDVFTEE